MSAGNPFVASHLDAYLRETLLGPDTLLKLYAPGGCSAERPPTNSLRPVIRWWQRTPGHDTIRQDGFAGRAQSNPEYIICVLDEQNAEQVDRTFGTAGMLQTPAARFMELAAERLYQLLHNRLMNVDSVSYYSLCYSDFIQIEKTTLGGYEVCVGWRVQFRIT